MSEIVEGAIEGGSEPKLTPTKEPKAAEQSREQPPADEWPFDTTGPWVDPCNPDELWGEG